MALYILYSGDKLTMNSYLNKIDFFDFTFSIRVIGGLFLLTSWILFHFFDIPFIEAIKMIVLGSIMIGGSFWLEHEKELLKI